MGTFIFTALAILVLQEQVKANITDFAELAQQKYFIDKTLFIKQFFEDKIVDLNGKVDKVLVITGPPGSGKSAIADMVRRYLQREVEPELGRPLQPEENSNYNLFCNETNPLSICKDEVGMEFALNNLGRHPLIHLDFAPLKKALCYKTFRQILRQMIAKAYRANDFLLNAVVPILWEMRCNMTSDQFKHYLNLSVEMSDADIAIGFLNLTAALYEYFDKPVYLIIDNYDALYDNLMFATRMIDQEDIKHLMSLIHNNIFQHNVGMRRALVTGRIRIRDPTIAFLWNNYTEHRWLDDHNYAKYYGFDKEEVETLVRRYVHEEEKINHTMHIIRDYYGGYYIQGQRTELHSISSVVNFLENDQIRKSYRAGDLYFDKEYTLFHIEQFESLAKDLLFNRYYITIDISEPMNSNTLFIFKDLRYNLHHEADPYTHYFYTYMFDLGLLGLLPNLNKGNRVPVTIPNRETYLGYCKSLVTCYKREHRYDYSHMAQFEAAMSAFTPESDRKQYQDLYNALYRMIRHSKHYPQVESDLQLFFFVMMLQKYPFAQKEAAEFEPKIDYFDKFILTVPQKIKRRVARLYHNLNTNISLVPPMARSDFVVVNKHGVAIVMENMFHRREPISKEGLRKDALEALAQAYLTYELAKDKPAKVFREAKHQLFIGMGFCEDRRNISLVFLKPPFKNLTYVEDYAPT